MMSNNTDPFRKKHRSEDDNLNTLVATQIFQELAEKVQRAKWKLIRALGAGVTSWFEFEDVLNRYHRQREEIIFKIAYQKDFIACGVHAASRLCSQQKDAEGQS